ncbi:MAG TPA: hypothetical protein VJH03_23720 [Blastocatellia bacterium]|nr:hypothetical protein [Blastocatellia bacterium]
MKNRKRWRRFWSAAQLVILLALGAAGLWDTKYIEAAVWPLWLFAVMNVWAALFPQMDGRIRIREEMSPTDLPRNAKIPIALMTEAEREKKS